MQLYALTIHELLISRCAKVSEPMWFQHSSNGSNGSTRNSTAT